MLVHTVFQHSPPHRDKGMTHLLRSADWRDLFDVVVVGARKPSFYSESSRPFRSMNSDLTSPSWQPVMELKKGEVYLQGNVNDFISMTGWSGSGVLYVGDHVFSDLAVSNQCSTSGPSGKRLLEVASAYMHFKCVACVGVLY